MKKQTTNQFLQMSKQETAKLTTVVKETLATGFSQAKKFSTGDMWNIQRRGTSMLQRRSFI